MDSHCTPQGDMRRYVVRFLRDDGSHCGLGVAVGPQTITAAHVIPLQPRDRMAWLEMDAVDGDGNAASPIVQSLNCTFDFAIKPAELLFLDGDDAVTFDGYFYAPDGKTRRETRVIAHRHSTWLTMCTELATPGCSGGPLFTADDALIGIVQMRATVHETKQTLEGSAVRIDLAAIEWFRREQGGFDTVTIKEPR